MLQTTCCGDSRSTTPTAVCWATTSRGSIAHVTMLGEGGLLTAEEADEILEGLRSILAEGR